MTARDLVTAALRILGVLREGGSLSGTQGVAGLRVFNRMLDAFPLERQLVYAIDRQLFALVANTQSYTLGPGGTWNTTPLYGVGTPRPVEIDSAYWQDPTTLDEIPVVLMTEGEFQSLNARTITGTVVQRLYYKPSMPQGDVFVWPTPTLVANMVLYLAKPWNAGHTLDTVLTLPPGYQRMLEYGLAEEWGSEYPNFLREDIRDNAREAKALVKRQNLRIEPMVSDLAGVTRGRRGAADGSMSGWVAWQTGRW